MIDKDKIKPGEYLYTRPGWNRKLVVTVERIDGRTMIYFKAGYNPLPLDDVPYDAVMTRIQ